MLIWSILTGIISGIIYDLFRIKSIKGPKKKLFRAVGDIFYWIITAIISTLVLYIVNSGEMRLYYYAGIIFGLMLYFKYASKYVLFVIRKVLDVVIVPYLKIKKVVAPIVVNAFKIIKKCFIVIKFSFKQFIHTFTNK